MSIYRTLQLDKRVFIKDSSVRCVFSPRSKHLLETRVRIVLVIGAWLFFIVRDSLSLFFEHFGTRVCESCLPVARAFFSETRRQFVIRDKNEKENTVDVYILRRYYVVCASICECICATARANTETWKTKITRRIMPRFWELP